MPWKNPIPERRTRGHDPVDFPLLQAEVVFPMELSLERLNGRLEIAIVLF